MIALLVVLDCRAALLSLEAGTRSSLSPPTGPEWTHRLHRLQPLGLARTRRAAQFIWLAKVNLVRDPISCCSMRSASSTTPVRSQSPRVPLSFKPVAASEIRRASAAIMVKRSRSVILVLAITDPYDAVGFGKVERVGLRIRHGAGLDPRTICP